MQLPGAADAGNSAALVSNQQADQDNRRLFYLCRCREEQGLHIFYLNKQCVY